MDELSPRCSETQIAIALHFPGLVILFLHPITVRKTWCCMIPCRLAQMPFRPISTHICSFYRCTQSPWRYMIPCCLAQMPYRLLSTHKRSSYRCLVELAPNHRAQNMVVNDRGRDCPPYLPNLKLFLSHAFTLFKTWWCMTRN